MQEHDDLDTVVNNLTELYRCIEVGSDDPYICGMKQLIVNPLAWVHAERIARAGRAAQSAEVRPDTAQQLRAEIAALATELQDFNDRRVAAFGRVAEIVAKMRQLSAV